jgi:hypothetical protein
VPAVSRKYAIHNGDAPQVLLASCGGDDTGGGLFSFDGHDVEQIDRLSTNGLHFADGRIIRLLRSWNDNDSIGEILLYDERGVERYCRVDSLVDGHDIAWDGHEFIVVSTSSNSIFWISPEGRIARIWKAPGEGDAWHLNCLLLRDNRIYVSAFGRFAGHREWVGRRDEPAGIVFDLTTGKDVLTGLHGPHHPRYFDDAWFVCNSVLGNVVRIEPATLKVSRQLQLGGWTRGVAISDDYLFVGESAHRYSAEGSQPASVAIVCRKTWALLDRFSLPCREVYDLVLVPPSMLQSLRRGFRTNHLRVSEQSQYAMFDEVGVKPIRLWATGDPLSPNACRISISADLPATVGAGTEIELECQLENLGGAILASYPPHPVHISYKWVDAATGQWRSSAEGLRSRLPTILPPAKPLRCQFRVKALNEPGDFILRVTLVQEHVAWFDDLDRSNSCSRLVHITDQANTLADVFPSRRAA